ncbi:hypothetical protein IOD16_20830 [Saccharothrix sp. 6-C]|uniref:hypothetical protein n=1 Tax=Saccharothrix sp. 6-C TaxID=2781735 RepID=UPI001917350F|nr:hypothetical protein [Saccharothrix sp. 6-C]QQQ73711.1 hypothetical protein IOD16_20830 [Saccharothrix sp. 6-C]
MVASIARHLPGEGRARRAAGPHLLITFDDSVSDIDLAAGVAVVADVHRKS